MVSSLLFNCKELVKNFRDLYNVVADFATKIDKSMKNTNNLQEIEFVDNASEELRVMIYDYIMFYLMWYCIYVGGTMLW